MEPVKVGIIGCGAISGIYCRNLGKLRPVELAACADLDFARAQACADEYGARALEVDTLLADPEIELVLNLTTPNAHFEVARAALDAGKHVYNEKPLAVEREEGRHLLDLAAEKGLLVGGAPDTFLGAGLQTCRKLIDEGAIGEPVAATAFMTCHGHESWHPAPEFYYQVGGGPMFDMGPYYLTALVSLMGAVRRATGSTRITFPTRTITSEPKRGTVIPVDVPTHVAGILDFRNGAIGTIITSFDVWAAGLPHLEIYGREGSLSAPDPNTFGGPVRVRRAGDDAWREVPLTHPYPENSRGLGVADMALALRSGGAPRAGGELAFHVLDIMHAIHEASNNGAHAELTSACARPEPMPEGGLDA